ncbi:hypothetical protein PLESTB_001565000 [Pleodorina starrii]|uniref:Peptide-methionine (S)-S-oxide reductase n=1 Tax=Pleodorina starrii TaxID=330485 RepID=A0A9W6BWV1_9CHLO|nr:hypothetical protein PLESTB_001565000 [Pleodorina starrii]GLC72747.1 hypothetical protein PLESTF_001289100 [Pleodorina starrii]
MSALLHRTQMNNRGLQTRPAASPGRMLASRIHLRHCREGVRAEAHAESRVAAAPPQTHREAAGLRGAFASVALAACLALQLPAGLPAQAVEGGSRMAEEAAAVTAATIEDSVAGATESGTAGGLQTVYFGNGCFWGRQKDFVDVEMKQLGRTPEKLTALVGYAAGTQTGPGGKVCYVYSDPRTHYDALGHAEVVQLGVSTDPRVAEEEMRAFAARYFQQFRQTPGGMQRSDPQDKGPAYRNVIGIPGGVNSPVFRVIQEENKYGMELREGRGNVMGRGGATEDDILNTVWVVDSAQLPFYRAERYHQFHNGLGKIFPSEYVRDLRNLVAGLGRIEPTGCPELPF